MLMAEWEKEWEKSHSSTYLFHSIHNRDDSSQLPNMFLYKEII